MRELWMRFVEWLFLRAFQSRRVDGTNPDDGGHMELRVAWNDPDRRGRNRPLFVVIMTHTRTKARTRMLTSPGQLSLFTAYADEGIGTQAHSFGYSVKEPPDYDTRWIRVPDES